MLTAAEIAVVVEALRPRVAGGQVQKIREPVAGTVVMHVRVPGRTTRLVLSGRPVAPRIAEAEVNGPTLPEPSTLGRWLRAALKGRRLLDLIQLPGERVVVLTFEAGQLVAELTGRTANLFACQPDGRIVAMAHRSTGRPLRPTQTWTPPPPRPAEATAPPRFDSPQAVEQAARALEAQVDGGQTETSRARLLRRARKRLDRLHRKVSADLARAEGAEQWRHAGELLKTQLHHYTRGMQTIEVTDWYAEGAPTITLELDPALDGPGNVARLFARYKKGRAGQVKAAKRLAEVEEQQFELELLAEEVLDVEALYARLLARRFLKPAGGGGRRAQVAPRRPFRAYQSSKGAQILVGRGGRDNHELTFAIARGNDLWLHVRDAPGAHVIVPRRGGAPHPETVLDAAALAVRHSDLKGEAVADVTVTERKHVRPIKGGPPGRVTVAAARTVTVHDADARADALTAVVPTPR